VGKDRPSPRSGHQLTREERSRGGKKGGAQKGINARREKMTVRQLLAEEAERNKGRIWGVFEDALVANLPDGSPDHKTRMDAVSKLNAEGFGRPLQPTEERGKGGQPVVFLWGDAAVQAAAAARNQAAVDAGETLELEVSGEEDG
jgi:hypothetical protein